MRGAKGAATLVARMTACLWGCGAEDPAGPVVSCSERDVGLLAPWLWRWRVLVLVDSRFAAPPELPSLFAELERVSTTGDLDGDGERDFLGPIDTRMEVRDVSFDEPLVGLVEDAIGAEWYERQVPWYVVLVSAGDAGPELYAEREEMPEAVRRIMLVGGIPPELVDTWHRDRDAVLADPRMSSEEPLCSRSDGVEPLPAPRLLDSPTLRSGAPHVVSLCSENWDRELSAPLVAAVTNHLAAGHCYELPSTTGGRAACTMYEVLAADAPLDCDDLPGRLPAPTESEPRRCEIIQQPLLTTEEPTDPGWFADDRTVWHERTCREDRSFVRFTPDAHPMPGSSFWLECPMCDEILGDASTAHADAGG